MSHDAAGIIAQIIAGLIVAFVLEAPRRDQQLPGGDAPAGGGRGRGGREQ